MNRPLIATAFFAFAATALGAQQAGSSNPYQGTSNPPADDVIVTTDATPAKPAAGTPATATEQPAAQADTAQPTSVDPSVNNPAAGSTADSGAAVNNGTTEPTLATRPAAAVDPDSDIVHPLPLGPGQIGEGTTIRVRLLDRLSTVDSQKGDSFRSQVASDVLAGGQVLIPAGAEIDGKVIRVSSGDHLGGHGSLRLQPETVILADGSRYQLHAEVTGTPGSNTRIGSEGSINPGSRTKRDGIEYGGAVGAGVVTGAILGGPVGAVTGGAIGAGVITTHLLVSHPQATLEPGSVLLFTLTETLTLAPANQSGN